MKEGSNSYDAINGTFNRRSPKKQKIEAHLTDPTTVEDIHRLINEKSYKQLQIVFEKKVLYTLLPPPTWLICLTSDCDLLIEACKQRQFIKWLAEFDKKDGTILYSIAHGVRQREPQQNKRAYEAMNLFRDFMSDKVQKRMDHLSEKRGYDLPLEPHRPSFPWLSNS